MSKIAIVTLFNDNYGSILQCFATKRFLESNGNKSVVLDYNVSNDLITKVVRRVKNIIKIVFMSSYRKQRTSIKQKKGLFPPSGLSLKTKEYMNKWVYSFLDVQNVSEKEMKNKYWQKQYNFFIVGSDQVWKMDYLEDSFCFLTFAPRNKRIALAASFGICEIPKYKQKNLNKALNNFDYVSVREETGVEIVKKYSNTRVCRIADPTFIYNADEWRSFAQDAIVPSQKYILVHFLNEPNESALESMVWLSEQLDLDIVALGYKYDAFNNLKRFVYMDGGPWEYISMIDHAEFVLTDSFHSSIFSINFDKRFFVFHRNYSVSKQTSRISDLLKRFSMEDRLIENVDALKNIYLKNQPAETRIILQKERATIRDYIQKSITGQVPQCFLQGEKDAT